MNRRFLLCGLLLSSVVGVQTVWLMRSAPEGPPGRAAFAVLLLLHVPAAALEWYVRPENWLVWLVIAVDCLLWGFGIAWALHWLRRTLAGRAGTDR